MRRALILLTASALAGAALTAAPAVGAVDPPAAADAASVPDQLLVGYAHGASAHERAQARSRAGARLVSVVVAESPGRSAVELVATPAGGRGQSERRFEADPKVTYAEPNWVHSHAATSNDPAYVDGSLWGMYGDATLPANQYGSQAGEAWATGNLGGDVYVGVIDEGIQTTHPDLDANIWTNPGEVADDGVDNDGNGYVDDVHGWDFDGGNNTVYDGTGDDHGTHVAGTIGAEGGNVLGVAGVAWNVKLISAKFLGANGGTTANAVAAVDYLTDLKTRHLINLVATNNSWGGGGYSQALYDAIERANAADILFVAAAGNGGSDGKGDDNDRTPHYPSSYANDNVIAVAAITSSGAKSTFSNYGATSVDLGAPGSGIASTLPDGTYGTYSGTSMATPHVTGAAVLYAAWKPRSSAASVKKALLDATIPTSGLSRTVTGGRLDAGAFGTVTPPAAPDTTAPAAPTDVRAADAATDGAIDVSWTAPMDSDVASYLVYRDGAYAATVSAPTTSWRDSGLVNRQQYSYTVAAVDAAGNVGALSDPPATASPTDATAPATPSGVTAVAGDGKVDLGWTANTEADLAGYEVWRTDVTTGPVALVQGATTWSDSQVVNGTTYSYSVLAYDTTGNRSASSATVTATPSANPSLMLLSATPYKVKGGWQQVDLTWSGGDKSTSVTVVRTGTSSNSYGTTNDGAHTDKTGRKAGGTYTYKLCQGQICSASLTVTF